MKLDKKIRKNIFRLIERLYKYENSLKKFIPGKSVIHYSGRVYDARELINLVDSSLDFWLTAGRFAKDFEKKFAKFLGVKHCLLTNSGSSANLLAVSALTSPKLGKLRLKAGDEVITTACGFPTTLNPILQNNLTPVLVDIDLKTFNIDTGQVERSITKKTKAIFIAHTLGNPVNLEKIIRIVRKYRLWLIEDNCDALGSKYKGQFTGTFGHISTSSFYPAHHITMGEGGAVLTNDTFLKKIIMSLRDWGRDCWCDTGHDNTCGKRFSQKFGELPFGYDHKYVYSHIGYNLKVTDMQAAIGVTQLEKLPTFIKKRRENFKFLYRVFEKYNEYLILPEAQANSSPSWFGFPVLVKDGAPFKRRDIVKYFEDKKIATRMLFGGNLLRQPAYKGIKYGKCQDLKNSDLVMNNLFWIGVYPGLTKHMLSYIKEILDNFFKKEL